MYCFTQGASLDSWSIQILYELFRIDIRLMVKVGYRFEGDMTIDDVQTFEECFVIFAGFLPTLVGESYGIRHRSIGKSNSGCISHRA